MTFDLVIRNGQVVDGTGAPAFHADVGISDDVIVEMGTCSERGRREIDAEGRIVTPGFIDGHTHMDAQVFWNRIGSNSCWHGVTSVAMGNCGFTLVPASERDKELVIRNLSRAEDIPREAMTEGIEWTWETFGEYLGALDAVPKGINYAGFVGHSALRTWAMGERAFECRASDEDLRMMETGLLEALRSGAIGFTTSRSPDHETDADQPVASRVAEWSELTRLVSTMTAEAPGAILEFPPEGMACLHRNLLPELRASLIELGRTTGATVMFSTSAQRPDGTDQLELFELISSLNEVTTAYGQVGCVPSAIVLSFRSRMPFDSVDEWREIRALPLDRQRRRLSDPSTREALIRAAHHGHYGRAIGAEVRKPPDFGSLVVLRNAIGTNPTVGELARAAGKDPVDLMIDLALETDFDQTFLHVLSNMDPSFILRGLRHPQTLLTSTDSGAHVNQICSAALHTRLLADVVRDRGEVELESAIRMVTADIADAFGFVNRGRLRVGYAADLNVIDMTHVAPRLPSHVRDLPGGAMRIVQGATGIDATIVNGRVTLIDGQSTGALPGRVLRRARQ